MECQDDSRRYAEPSHEDLHCLPLMIEFGI